MANLVDISGDKLARISKKHTRHWWFSFTLGLLSFVICALAIFAYFVSDVDNVKKSIKIIRNSEGIQRPRARSEFLSEIEGYVDGRFTNLRRKMIELGQSGALQGAYVFGAINGTVLANVSIGNLQPSDLGIYPVTSELLETIAIAHLDQKRHIFLHERVSKVLWTEFSQNGKAWIKVEDLVTHQAGLHVLSSGPLTLDRFAATRQLHLALDIEDPLSYQTQVYSPVLRGFWLSQLYQRINRNPNMTLLNYIDEHILKVAGLSDQVSFGNQSVERMSDIKLFPQRAQTPLYQRVSCAAPSFLADYLVPFARPVGLPDYEWNLRCDILLPGSLTYESHHAIPLNYTDPQWLSRTEIPHLLVSTPSVLARLAVLMSNKTTFTVEAEGEDTGVSEQKNILTPSGWSRMKQAPGIAYRDPVMGAEPVRLSRVGWSSNLLRRETQEKLQGKFRFWGVQAPGGLVLWDTQSQTSFAAIVTESNEAVYYDERVHALFEAFIGDVLADEGLAANLTEESPDVSGNDEAVGEEEEQNEEEEGE